VVDEPLAAWIGRLDGIMIANPARGTPSR